MEIPQRRSDDTLESVLALDPETDHARIALWLATADESQLAAYWAGYKLAAVAGTGDERYAWWSWACNDPKAALAAGKQAGHDAIIQVACG
ncbi:MAG: hypothetical protein EOP88_09425 [Verrucomicrobiaceae bacterium]|nr:MAG: hypothetical protein EOP88_09425 [Verrucomicrobiaceae bacterium]